MPVCGRADIPGHSAFCFTSLLQVCSWWAAEPEKRHDDSIPAGASGTKNIITANAGGRAFNCGENDNGRAEALPSGYSPGELKVYR